MPGPLVVRSLAGGVLAEVPPHRLCAKSSPAEVWRRQALRAQAAIAAQAQVPRGRVAIFATDAEGTQANAVFAPAPPEVSLVSWEGSAEALESLTAPAAEPVAEDEADAIVAALFCFLWEHLGEGTRNSFHFDAFGKLRIEACWWDTAVQVVVTLGELGLSWTATIRSPHHAEGHGLTPENCVLTAAHVRAGLVGRTADGQLARLMVD